jgi:N-acyl-D-amino-acid deacylase
VSIINFVSDEVGTLQDVHNIMTHPATMVGSDGLLIGSKPHPRTYGTFARYLRLYPRELSLLSWEDAIRKITSLPAQRLGLQNRGLLKERFFADIVIFNPETVTDKATFEDGRQFAEGIEYVLVNGELVIDEGVHTGQTPGRTLR